MSGLSSVFIVLGSVLAGIAVGYLNQKVGTGKKKHSN